MNFQQSLETLQFQRSQFKSRNTPRGIACEIGEAGSEGGAGSGQQHTNRPIGAHRGACGPAGPGQAPRRRAEPDISDTSPTGVEGAGGSGGPGRASRSTTPSEARVWRSRGRPGPTVPGTPAAPQATTRSADGSRAGRRPPAHTAARPKHTSHAAAGDQAGPAPPGPG